MATLDNDVKEKPTPLPKRFQESSEPTHLPKRFQESMEPSVPSSARKNSRLRLGRKRNSEWVFRPLRLKFKVKQLEQLYKYSVYRQKQALLLGACMLMVGLCLLILLTFVGSQKVS